jgi:hypothetical protein
LRLRFGSFFFATTPTDRRTLASTPINARSPQPFAVRLSGVGAMPACPAVKADLMSDTSCAAARFVRVPCSYLGVLLDHGRSSAYGIHLTAIRASKGPTFSLNEKHVAKEYRVGRRAFQAGIRLMKACQVLERTQTGRRTYAVERLAAASRNYVLLDQRLLSASSSLVAFILTVNLSPKPIRHGLEWRRLLSFSYDQQHYWARRFSPFSP